MAGSSRFGGHDAGRIVARNEAVGNARGLGLSAPGLRELRRSFRRLPPEVDHWLQVEIEVAARPILARGRENAPHRSGRLARSLRIVVQQRGVAIVSRLPYANVIHWGGTTGAGHQPNVPWSGSVFVEPSLFLSRSLEEHEGQFIDAASKAVDRAAVRAGWR